MKLTATAIKNAKPKDKAYKLPDGNGLFLEVPKSGNKRWRYRYFFNSKEQMLSLGLFPDISLKEVRELHHEARNMVANGINPSDARKAKKETKSDANCFEAIAHEWWERNKHTWTERHGLQIYRKLEINIFPWLGSTPITEITPPLLLKQLRRIEDRGAIETAHRVKSNVGQIIRYAIATGRADRDITQDLKDALMPVKKVHFATIIDPKKIGDLLNAIDGYEGHYIVKHALKLAPLTFVRPGELRHAEWDEFNFETNEWRIPPEKMKAGALHVIPLSKQALQVLEDIRPLTGRGKYVFPCLRSSQRPMSNNAINAALRRMGYSKEEITGHGFRSMASTLLNEQGYNRDHIERQLAHTERNNVRAAYNHAEYLPERTTMMQDWADYLDNMKG